ncbi:MAG: hypothetical protein ACJASL_000787 [Paraglaciecola sp.]
MIVGGGSAGWITAGIIAAGHSANQKNGLKVTLIESPDVKIIGVGEGTWPSMRTTLQQMGISESLFISTCGASFKQGSKFVGWKTGDPGDMYYHPFMTPPGYTSSNLHSAWQNLSTNTSFADTVCVQGQISEAGRAPKQIATPDYAGVTNYGYHLDAEKFVKMLQAHCVNTLGVKHVLDHVTHIESAENADIASIGTKQSGNIAGDLFVDCTGVKSLLLGQHYKIPFIEKKDVLFNDSAITVQVPYEEGADTIASATISTAQECGWVWDIGLPSRRGTGYVYSSAHCDEAKAQDTFREYLAQSIGHKKAENLSPRRISFVPGHREKFWHKNCIAIGMSSGFLEPLEASALALVELSVTMLNDEMPVTRQHMDIVSKRFNERFIYRWDRVIDFLKLHYVLNQRTGQEYWQDNHNPSGISDRLQELLALWRYQSPSRYDFIQNEEVFPSASYQFVLYGMGFKTESRPTQKQCDNMKIANQYFSDNKTKLAQYMAGLPSNRDLINQICQRPLN